MNAPTTDSQTGPPYVLPTPFDGYPYLVTRIGRTQLRHMAILPSDWPRERLLGLARRQAKANQLETCLCLGPTEAVCFTPRGTSHLDGFIPTGLPVVERLALAEPIPETTEVIARRAALAAHRELMDLRGCVFGDGLEDGRLATPADMARLGARDAECAPSGRARCRTCRTFAGEYLALKVRAAEIAGPGSFASVAGATTTTGVLDAAIPWLRAGSAPMSTNSRRIRSDTGQPTARSATGVA